MSINKKSFRNSETELALLLFFPQALVTFMYWPSAVEELKMFILTQIGSMGILAAVAWWRYRKGHRRTHRPFVWAMLQAFLFTMMGSFALDGTLVLSSIRFAIAVPWLVTFAYGVLILSDPLRYTKFQTYDGEGFPTGRSKRFDRMLSASMLAGFILGQVIEAAYEWQIRAHMKDKGKAI